MHLSRLLRGHYYYTNEVEMELLNGQDPYLYLRHVLERIAEHPINRIDELLPWNVAAKSHDVRRQAA